MSEPGGLELPPSLPKDPLEPPCVLLAPGAPLEAPPPEPPSGAGPGASPPLVDSEAPTPPPPT